MIRTITTLIMSLFLLTPLWAQNKNIPSKPPSISTNPAFKHGEQLKYLLHYGFITGGEAIISTSLVKTDSNTLFHSVAQAKTTGLVDKIFRVNDIYESYYNPSDNLPVKSIRNIHEGNYKYYNEVMFNRKDTTVFSQKSGVHKVPEKLLDMVSAFFYIRRIDFTNIKPGDIISINTYFGDELFPFYIIFKGRDEVETDAGKFKCLRFLPIVEPGRIFKDNDDMRFWLSDDQNKIPIRVEFDMIVGSFKCDLVSYSNLKYLPVSKIHD